MMAFSLFLCCRTALILASESNAVSVAEVLVQRGADLSAVDSQGHDVTHYIKLLGNSEVKTALVAALSRQQISGKSYAKTCARRMQEGRTEAAEEEII